VGVAKNAQGQIQPIGNINGYPLFDNESQYELASQKAVDAINDASGDYFSQQAYSASYDLMVTNNIMPVTSNEMGQNIALKTGAAGAALGSFYDAGLYLHYLPVSKRFRVYSRPKVNQYTKNTKISLRGAAVLFFINEGIVVDDYLNGRINSDQLEIGTINNILGSISPQMGGMFLTYELIKYINVKTEEFINRPEVIRTYNRMNHEFEFWKYQGAPQNN